MHSDFTAPIRPGRVAAVGRPTHDSWGAMPAQPGRPAWPQSAKGVLVDLDVERAVAVAREAAAAAGTAALAYWRTDLRVERKSDRTPVTAADRAAEAAALR